MFEQQVWADLDPTSGEPLWLVDEPERSDEEYLAELEWLIAQDPLNRPEPSAAEVIARGETEAISPGLIALLWQLDPHVLEEDQRIGYAVAMDRVANAAHARRGLGVAAVVAVSPDGVEVPRELHAAAQLGAALGLGRASADTLVTASTQFAGRLPAARELGLAGGLSWRKASALATSTLALTGEQARSVEAKVLPKSWDQPVGKFDAEVRKAVDVVDPDGIEARKKQRRLVIRLVRHHYGDGMGQLFADMPSEQLEMVWTAATAWARRRKSYGDPRTLDELRVAALPVWASSFLSHGDPSHCDRYCQPTTADSPDTDSSDSNTGDADSSDTDTPDADSGSGVEVTSTAPSPPVVESEFSLPTSHGRRVKLTVMWDLSSLLGLTRHAGLLLDSDTVIAASTVRELIAAGLRVRRGVIDADGQLIDLTRTTWLLPPADGSVHPAPVELLVTTTARLADLPLDQQWALADLDNTDPTLAAVLRELLDHPLSADDLDAHPDDETPAAALAAYVCLRAGHPVNPTAGPTPARAGDLDHHDARADGGKTERANLGPVVRRWHRLKTFDGWTVKQTPQGWLWTSPTGRKYLIEPFDYRLGP